MSSKIKYFLVVLLFIFSNHLVAQKISVIDSLQNALKTIKADTVKVNCLNSISRQYIIISDVEMAMQYADSAYVLADKIDFKKGIAKASFNIGNGHWNHNDYQKARESIMASLKISRELGYNDQVIECLLKMGRLHAANGNPEEALKALNSSLNFSEEVGSIHGIVKSRIRIGDFKWDRKKFQEAFEQYLSALCIAEVNGFKKGMADSFFGISMVYQSQGNYSEALKNLKIALNTRKEIGDDTKVPNMLRQLGNIYLTEGDIPAALKNYLTALEMLQERGVRRGTAPLYHNIGMIYESQGNFSKAEENYIMAETIREDAGITVGITMSKIFLGNLYIRQQQFEKARKQLEEALLLAKQDRYKYSLPEIYKGLSLLDSAEGNFGKALEHYKLYIVYKDSIFIEKSNKHLAQLEIQFETEKKDREIELLSKDKVLKEQKLERQRLIQSGMITGTVLLLLLGLLLFRSFHLRKKLEKQQAIALERKRIGDDLHDDVGSDLSRIMLLSELMRREDNTPETRKEAENISIISQELISNIGDIIWALNSKNDFLENMVAYIRRYAAEYFENSDVKLSITTPGKIPRTPISAERRRNIFYTVKEALHNIIKHSRATEAELIFSLHNDLLSVVIRDNGKGMCLNEVNRFGNGLKSMENRMKSINGTFRIENHDGIKITLSIRM